MRSQHARSMLATKCGEGGGRACQRLFKVGAWQRYFEVAATSPSSPCADTDDRLRLFFQQQEDDIWRVHGDTSAATNVVEGFGHGSAQRASPTTSEG